MDYEAFFDEADADGSGSLTYTELRQILEDRGYNDTDQLKDIFERADASGDDRITKEEFMEAMTDAPPGCHKKATYRALFKSFDKDGSGQISRDELDKVFDEMGNSKCEEDIARIIELADNDGSGTLSYEELIEQVFGVTE